MVRTILPLANVAHYLKVEDSPLANVPHYLEVEAIND